MKRTPMRNDPGLLSGKRICVLTTGHLATSPRMTRAADTFVEAGAHVHLISTRSTRWAEDADADIVRRRAGAWTWDVVDYRKESTLTYLRSGARQKLALQLAKRLSPDRLPLYVAGSARERVFPEVVRKTGGMKVDFVYGGGAGLSAAYFAGRKLGVPFGVDLEDFHTGDQVDSPSGRLLHAISARIERDVLLASSLRTTGSEDISVAYRKEYGVQFVTVNNSFRTKDGQRSRSSGEGALQLYWFSQMIGPGRGLEDVVSAVSLAGIDADLHLQGSAMQPYLSSLIASADKTKSSFRILEHPPFLPDEVVAECSKYDVGLSLETNDVLNRSLCLTNKSLAYVAAGMALILTDTLGQRRLADDLDGGAFIYAPGDVSSLAKQLSMWASDRNALQRAKDATFDAARRRWNWDDPSEKGRLIGAVSDILTKAR
ncbi:MAG: hypothetical protein ABI556_11420 [Gemmatimonadales bacterium]